VRAVGADGEPVRDVPRAEGVLACAELDGLLEELEASLSALVDAAGITPVDARLSAR
jgi:hypothetical protein